MENTEWKFSELLPSESEVSQTINQYCTQLIADSTALLTRLKKESSQFNTVSSLKSSSQAIQKEFQSHSKENSSAHIEKTGLYLSLLFHQLNSLVDELSKYSRASSYALPQETYAGYKKTFQTYLETASQTPKALKAAEILTNTVREKVRLITQNIPLENIAKSLYTADQQSSKSLLALAQDYKSAFQFAAHTNEMVLATLVNQISYTNSVERRIIKNITYKILISTRPSEPVLNAVVISLLGPSFQSEKNPLTFLVSSLDKFLFQIEETTTELNRSTPLEQINCLMKLREETKVIGNHWQCIQQLNDDLRTKDTKLNATHAVKWLIQDLMHAVDSYQSQLPDFLKKTSLNKTQNSEDCLKQILSDYSVQLKKDSDLLIKALLNKHSKKAQQLIQELEEIKATADLGRQNFHHALLPNTYDNIETSALYFHLQLYAKKRLSDKILTSIHQAHNQNTRYESVSQKYSKFHQDFRYHLKKRLETAEPLQAAQAFASILEERLQRIVSNINPKDLQRTLRNKVQEQQLASLHLIQELQEEIWSKENFQEILKVLCMIIQDYQKGEGINTLLRHFIYEITNSPNEIEPVLNYLVILLITDTSKNDQNILTQVVNHLRSTLQQIQKEVSQLMSAKSEQKKLQHLQLLQNLGDQICYLPIELVEADGIVQEKEQNQAIKEFLTDLFKEVNIINSTFQQSIATLQLNTPHETVADGYHKKDMTPSLLRMHL